MLYKQPPSWEEIIEHLHGELTSSASETVVRVLVSKDRARRVLICQSEHGYYRTRYEQIYVWDEDEWNFFGNDPNRYPAYWNEVGASWGYNSFYGTEEDAIKAVTDSREYEMYFI